MTTTYLAQAEIDPHALLRQLSTFREASHARSWFELAVTVAGLLVFWMLAFAVIATGNPLGFLLCVPAGAFLVRLFLIQHDCGHGAFFRLKAMNDWVGRIIGVITLTPYDYWRRTHAMHHASTGNLDARGVGDVDTLTVAEFHGLSPIGRLGYRFSRHPAVLFGLGPAYQFLLRHRLPLGLTRKGWRPWASTLGTNISIVAAVAALAWALGLESFLLVQIPITLVASTLGVWFFYVQHQFEETHWDRDSAWSFHSAALHGSSYYELPRVLRWLTANIGAHHVHHLASRVPFYRMPEILRQIPELARVNRIGFRESLRTVKLVLWDEQKRRLVSFSEAQADYPFRAFA